MGRCTAKSKRSGEQCKNWALRGKGKCKFHGGKSTGPKTTEGKEKSRKAHLKHGFRTKKSQMQIRKLNKLLDTSFHILDSIKQK